LITDCRLGNIEQFHPVNQTPLFNYLILFDVHEINLFLIDQAIRVLFFSFSIINQYSLSIQTTFSYTTKDHLLCAFL
jgi:hypothetical protein